MARERQEIPAALPLMAGSFSLSTLLQKHRCVNLFKLSPLSHFELCPHCLTWIFLAKSWEPSAVVVTTYLHYKQQYNNSKFFKGFNFHASVSLNGSEKGFSFHWLSIKSLSWVLYFDDRWGGISQSQRLSSERDYRKAPWKWTVTTAIRKAQLVSSALEVSCQQITIMWHWNAHLKGISPLLVGFAYLACASL